VGGEFLFAWLVESEATPDDLEALAGTDEGAWIVEQEEVMLYPAARTFAAGMLICRYRVVMTRSLDGFQEARRNEFT
jgi:hypothetical protein